MNKGELDQELWSTEDITAILANIRAATSCTKYTVAWFVHWRDLGRVAHCMTGAGFSNVMPYFWYKKSINNLGGMHFLPAVECILLAHHPNAKECTVDVDANPVLRHAFVMFGVADVDLFCGRAYAFQHPSAKSQ